MADLLQSSSTTATTAPSYYTDYLSNLASKGTAAGAAATSPTSTAAWDPNANQNAAFNNVAANVGNYQPGLATAGQTLGNAAATNVTGATNPYLTAGTTTSGLSQANPYLQQGASSAADLVGGYMNPYTQSVVDQIAKANQQNIAQNLSPGITSGAVGGGQFGSQRGANALSLGISNANLGALTQQTQALQSGYSDALKAAQQQRLNQLTAGNTAGTLQNTANQNQVAAGQVAGNAANQQGQLQNAVGQNQAALANQTQTQGLADTSALATLGAQQQTLAQNKVLQPLDVLGKQASIMSGAQLPMSTTSTMNASPLAAIAGLGATAAGLFSTPSTPAGGTPGTSAGQNILSGISNAWNKISGKATAPVPNASSTTGWADSSGNPVNADGTPASTFDNSTTMPTGTTTSVNPDMSTLNGTAYDPNAGWGGG